MTHAELWIALGVDRVSNWDKDLFNGGFLLPSLSQPLQSCFKAVSLQRKAENEHLTFTFVPVQFASDMSEIFCATGLASTAADLHKSVGQMGFVGSGSMDGWSEPLVHSQTCSNGCEYFLRQEGSECNAGSSISRLTIVQVISFGTH
ncbi:zinc finger protein GLI2 [Platysternon megacephalum]|uniref:Zinc finger protein GLI2 n=1 Tax=Platysternon megacephalum TaxID=55544 RepID=A0A4D9EQL7_9SAUR|nr:zinc finger protein GLI2 [Platysternon megacephalum]